MNFFAAAALASGVSAASAAYTTFSGIDTNGDPETPLVTVTNSSNAEAALLSKLKSGVGTETFEGFAVGTPGPLSLSFVDPSSSTNITATLSGGSGKVGSTDIDGRYSIPSDTTSKFWLVNGADSSSAFTVVFSQVIAAFGFYGTDIGDFGGSLSIELLGGDLQTVIKTFSVPTTSSDGSTIYFGVLAGAASEDFKAIRFVSTATSTDFFGFDNFTVAARAQVVTDEPPPNPTPLPGTLALAGLGLLALGTRKRQSN
ncbi:MAG: PEP-CTERM sorting domain-containing protein [Rubrivivax sp.]